MVSTAGATITALGAALLLSGCSIFTPPKAKPVIEDRVSDWGVPKVSVFNGRIQVNTVAPVLDTGDKKPVLPLGSAPKETDK
jgi:hypothetical protein